MAHAHISVYAKPASVKYLADVDEIFVYCGGSHLCMKADEAAKLRDDLSCAITEAAQQHAQAVAHDAQPAQAAQPVGVPDGWVMVLREPTKQMIGAYLTAQKESVMASDRAWGCSDPEQNFKAGYSALLACTPHPPVQPSADAEITDDMVREWMERNDLACVTFGDARTAIEDARSLEYAARAAEGDA